MFSRYVPGNHRNPALFIGSTVRFAAPCAHAQAMALSHQFTAVWELIGVLAGITRLSRSSIDGRRYSTVVGYGHDLS